MAPGADRGILVETTDTVRPPSGKNFKKRLQQKLKRLTPSY